jgi:hypothetical protein
MYNYILDNVMVNMTISFVTKLAKSGSDTNGNQRRIIIVPTDKVKEVIKNYEGKQVKITIEDI